MFHCKILLPLLGIFALASAIPSSIMEDIKDAHLRAPVKTNKVKRAQEFIMFGNQQNRGSGLGAAKSEKRAHFTGIGVPDDNSLTDDEETMPAVMPEIEEHAFDSNQLGKGMDHSYPQARDLYYNLLLRNLERLPKEPSYGQEYTFPSYVLGRPKRTVSKTRAPTPVNASYRTKREYSMSPEDLLAILRLWENEKGGHKFSQPKNYYHWPSYENDGLADDSDDDTYGGYQEDNNGVWYDSPVAYSRVGASRDKDLPWPKPKKSSSFSQRPYERDLSNYGFLNAYDSYDGPSSRTHSFL